MSTSIRIPSLLVYKGVSIGLKARLGTSRAHFVHYGFPLVVLSKDPHKTVVTGDLILNYLQDFDPREEPLDSYLKRNLRPSGKPLQLKRRASKYIYKVTNSTKLQGSSYVVVFNLLLRTVTIENFKLGLL